MENRLTFHAALVLSAFALLACFSPPRIPSRSISTPADGGVGGAPGAGGARGGSGGTGGSSANAGSGGAAAEADAAIGGNLDSAPGPALLQIGRACTSSGACVSGACIDGYCCDSACAGACMACDLSGSEGTCANIPTGQDPDDDCQADPPTSCGRDGTCDGSGACRHQPAGTECMPGSCNDATEHAAATCDGAGQCRPGGTRSCGGNTCAGGSCGGTCAGDGDCQAGFFCEATACRQKRAAGSACSSDQQCSTSHCVDGVCCGTACADSCYVCNLPGAAGTCSPVPDGMDPRSQCLAESSGNAPCGRVGGCNGRGACRLRPDGTSCGQPSCAASRITALSCDGKGACLSIPGKDCGNYLCNGASDCFINCSTNDQCKPGFVCQGFVCVTSPPTGGAKIASLEVHDTGRANGWSIHSNLQPGSSGAHPWSDNDDCYIARLDGASAALAGNAWIEVATESKKYTSGPQATLRLNGTADVFIAVDDRWGTPPSFTSGWADTGWNFTVWESSAQPDRAFSVYAKLAISGSIDLPKIGDNDAFNYFVIVR